MDSPQHHGLCPGRNPLLSLHVARESRGRPEVRRRSAFCRRGSGPHAPARGFSRQGPWPRVRLFRRGAPQPEADQRVRGDRGPALRPDPGPLRGKVLFFRPDREREGSEGSALLVFLPLRRRPGGPGAGLRHRTGGLPELPGPMGRVSFAVQAVFQSRGHSVPGPRGHGGGVRRRPSGALASQNVPFGARHLSGRLPSGLRSAHTGLQSQGGQRQAGGGEPQPFEADRRAEGLAVRRRVRGP